MDESDLQPVLKYSHLSMRQKLDEVIRLACETQLELLVHPHADAVRRLAETLEQDTVLRSKNRVLSDTVAALHHEIDGLRRRNAELETIIRNPVEDRTRIDLLDHLMREKPRFSSDR